MLILGSLYTVSTDSESQREETEISSEVDFHLSLFACMCLVSGEAEISLRSERLSAVLSRWQSLI